MSKRISDIPEASEIDPRDQILFLQASTKKTKRISRDNFAKSPGFSESVIESSETGEGEADVTGPATPSGIVVVSVSELMPDGVERVIIRAKINPNTDSDLDSYGWFLRRINGTPTFDGLGKLSGYSTTQIFGPVLDTMKANGSIGTDGKVTKEWIVVPNTWYEVKVCSIDSSGNTSEYTELNNATVILSTKDNTPPAAPTGVTANSAIRSVFLSWTNPPDKDLAYVKVNRPSSPSLSRTVSSATRSGTTVTIATSSAHGFSNGNSVTIAGLSGSVYANGSRTVTVINSTQFSYSLISGGGSETYSLSNSIATLTSNVTLVFEGYADAFTDTTTQQGSTYHYWLTAVDYSGNESVTISNVAQTTPGTVANTDIDDFAVNATKMYNNTIVLEGDSWTSGGTGTYTISWNSHFLYYRGVKYTVSAGSSPAGSYSPPAPTPTTRTSYVYATIPVSGTSITYNVHPVDTAGSYPTLTDSMFMIASNVNGVYDLAWNAIANAVIGSAYIQAAAIDTAKIREVNADRISTGTIDAKTLTITGGGKIISSGATSFDSGEGFWIEGGAGSASKFGIGDLNAVTSNPFLKFSAGVLTVQGQIRSDTGYFGTSTGVLIDFNGLTVGGSGRIQSDGMTYNPAVGAVPDYFSGSGGFFLGRANNIYQLFIGKTDNPSADTADRRFLRWNGTSLTMAGEIRAVSGYIGGLTSGWQIGAGTISNTSGIRTTTLTADAKIVLSSTLSTMTFDNSSNQGVINITGSFPVSITGGVAAANIVVGGTGVQCIVRDTGIELQAGRTLLVGSSTFSSIFDGANAVQGAATEVVTTITNSTGFATGQETFRMRGQATLNSIYLRHYFNRHTAGSSWDGVAIRLQHHVDSTAMGYIAFNPANGSQGIGFGVGASERFRVVLGNVEVRDCDFRVLSSGSENARIDVSGNLTARSTATANLEASITTAVDVKNVNLRIYNGASQTARIRYDTGEYFILGNPIIGSRKTGWTAATGTATRTSFDTSTVSTAQLAERLKALLDDLISHGLIGS